MSEAPAASRSRPAATIHVPPSARTTPSWPASRVTDGVVVTKRSGQEKRRSYRVTRRLVEPARGRHPGGGSGQQQTKYESETPPQGLRFANKASPIFVQTGARALRIVASSSPRSFPAPAGSESIVRRGRKASANQSLAESPTATELCRTRRMSSSLVAETLPPLERPWPNPGPGRRDRGQTGSESATRRFARFGARKATAIGRRPEPSQIMAPKGLNRTGGASQSIIAALRMQTMVACAGFSLRFGCDGAYRSGSAGSRRRILSPTIRRPRPRVHPRLPTNTRPSREDGRSISSTPPGSA